MPYGRGGAGNIEAAAANSRKIAEDVEAQQPRAEAPLPSSTSKPTPANLNQDYAHSGRGGAGNWYSPKELSQTGNFETTPEQPKAATAEKEIVTETRRRGRGGAGNFVWTDEDEEEARREKEETEIELREMVAQDVEKGLAKPDRAFVRQGDE